MSFTYTIAFVALNVALFANAAHAQEISILNDGRDFIEVDGRTFEIIDDMLLEYGDTGIKSVQPIDVRLWPDGILPIEFEANYPEASQEAFFDACEWWSNVSRVRCIPRTVQNDRILVEAGSGNTSFVGRIGGAQPLTLQNQTNRGIIAHEIAHALGFAHQHNSPERDRYVNVLFENIQQGTQHNFRRLPQAIVFGFYDFCSIMHYPLNAFSSNNSPTIVIKGEAPNGCTPGQRDEITIEDSMGMAGAYGRDPEDQLFVEVPDFTEFSGSSLTNEAWAYQRYGLRTNIMAGTSRDECVRHTICERTCYTTKASRQDPAFESRVEFGSTVDLVTYVEAKYFFYQPIGQQCP